jgi:hypothetical protein
MHQITSQSLTKALTSSKVDQSDKYLITYPTYVSYFQNKENLTSNDIIAGVGFVYSWMPRILSISTEAIDLFLELATAFSKAKNGEIAKQLINGGIAVTGGSVVAASKLLHFIFPSEFPIYDSHIFRYFWKEVKPYHYNVSKLSNYNDYRARVQTIEKEDGMKELMRVVNDKIGYPVSPLRAIEFSIFHVSKSENLLQGAQDCMLFKKVYNGLCLILILKKKIHWDAYTSRTMLAWSLRIHCNWET